MNTETDEGLTLPNLIDRIAAAVTERMRPVIPLNIDLWDLETIGAYLKRDPNTVGQRIACLPDFPNAIRIPSEGGARGRPLWKASEVIAWTEKQQRIPGGRKRRSSSV